ncbi:hypothetical protein EsH8_IV_000039 [Colletotrichum jinshuiense]
MEFTSPSRSVLPAQRPHLLSSIARLKDAIRDAEAEADMIETQIAYKQGQIQDLECDRLSHDGPTTDIDNAIRQAQAKCADICDTLDEKREGIAILKDKLRRREAKIAAIPPVESTHAPDVKDNGEAAELLAVTSTLKSQVFTFSDDGKTFNSPAMLRGVPVLPISEDDPYWKSHWIKFGDAVNEDRVEREYQHDVELRRQPAQPGTPSAEEKEDAEKEFKRYQRKMNEARVIRKWFHPGRTAHPNQLMAKEHLPETGLCVSHVLYKICNILSRLNALYERGELGMPPLYFLLWRMSVSLDRQPHTAIKTFCRVIINEDHPAYDDILRRAEVRGAQHMGDYNFYNRKYKGLSPAKDQVPRTAAGANENSSFLAPGQSTTPSHGSRGPLEALDQQQQPTPLTVAIPIIDLTGAPESRSPVRLQTPTTLTEQNRHKRRQSWAAIEQQPSEENGSKVPLAKKPRKAVGLTEIQLSLRPRSSTESPSSDLSAPMPEMHMNEEHAVSSVRTGVEAQIRDFAKGATTGGDPSQNDTVKEATGDGASVRSNINEGAEAASLTPKIRRVGSDEASQHQVGDQNDDFSKAMQDVPGDPNAEIQIHARNSPFPKTGKKVSHGFVFPWLPCTERESLESYI